MSEHTPGPWIADRWGWILDDTAQYIITPKRVKHDPRCLDIDWKNPADLKLVLAAPDLLEACQEAEEYIARSNPDYRDTDWRRKVLLKLDEVIEKSTGEEK